MFDRTQVVAPGAIQSYSAKSALFSTAAVDRGTLFDCTGSFTVTIGTTALTAGWDCWIRNVSGTQTLDPAGAVTINGAANYSLANAGDMVHVVFDGTNFLVEHTQRPSTVAISGGTINGTPIGGSTPAAGAFTTVSATGVITQDTGSGANPVSTPTNLAIQFLSPDGGFSRLSTVSFGGSGFVFTARAVGGTRASPTPTTANQSIYQMTALGYDGVTFSTSSSATYGMFAGSLWSGTNKETYHAWTCTAAGSTTAPQRMVLFGSGNLGLGSSPADDGTNNLQVAGSAKISSVTDSTSVITGAIICSGGIGVAKRLTLDGDTGKTLRIVNATANATVATTLGSKGPTGSTAGDPLGWMRIDINGTDRYIPFW